MLLSILVYFYTMDHRNYLFLIGCQVTSKTGRTSECTVKPAHSNRLIQNKHYQIKTSISCHIQHSTPNPKSPKKVYIHCHIFDENTKPEPSAITVYSKTDVHDRRALRVGNTRGPNLSLSCSFLFCNILSSPSSPPH